MQPSTRLPFSLCLVTVLVVAGTSAAHATPGALDPTLSGDGKLTTDFSPLGDSAYAVAVRPNGKIVVAGTAREDSDNSKFAVARYKANGSLDATFGGDGRVITDFTPRLDVADGVVIQADGKVVVAGTSLPNSRKARFALVRYSANGTLDATFGGDGKVTTQLTPGRDTAGDVALQANGKILVTGAVASFRKFALVRYKVNGALDPTFGGDGKVRTDITSGRDRANDVTVQSDGKIVIAGAAGFRNGRFALARYNTDGSLDTTFGGDGKVLTDFTNVPFALDESESLAIQTDGKIVAAGAASLGTDNPPVFALARYNADGSLDSTFSGDGKLTTQFTATEGGDIAWGVALQTDGKIVAAGHASFGAHGGNSRFALARYDSDGSLDTTFGGDGRVTTDFTTVPDFAFGGVVIQANGRIVAAGAAGWADGFNPKFALARYLAA
jgi:uncharacterized delta-60 repeat protein